MHWLGPAHGRPLLLHARMPNIADVLKAEVAQMAHGTAFADRSTQCGSSGAPGGQACFDTRQHTDKRTRKEASQPVPSELFASFLGGQRSAT